jgi:hypothetical protein
VAPAAARLAVEATTVSLIAVVRPVARVLKDVVTPPALKAGVMHPASRDAAMPRVSRTASTTVASSRAVTCALKVAARAARQRAVVLPIVPRRAPGPNPVVSPALAAVTRAGSVAVTVLPTAAVSTDPHRVANSSLVAAKVVLRARWPAATLADH